MSAIEQSHRPRLAHALAWLYTPCIIYASLYPFISWEMPTPDILYWLTAPSRLYHADFWVNFFAYVPLGFFIGLAGRKYRLLQALIYGTLLSFVMESCQWWMPPRDADRYDLFANILGVTLGGTAAWFFAVLPHLRSALYRCRRCFLEGWLGDFGLALLIFWLAAQANPGIALFSIVFDPAFFASTFLHASDEIGAFTETQFLTALIGALQIAGVSLFAALLIRERRHTAIIVTTFILAAVLLKGVMAFLMLNKEALSHYQGWLAISAALFLGFLLFHAFFTLSRPKQVTVCAVILLSSLLPPLFLPDLLTERAPSSLFNDRYAHLLHFNGLTHTILLGWPLAASLWLFFLSGQPRWGDQNTELQ